VLPLTVLHGPRWLDDATAGTDPDPCLALSLSRRARNLLSLASLSLSLSLSFPAQLGGRERGVGAATRAPLAPPLARFLAFR